eukprot:8380527-Pyramimonas_sp.AAC.1
MVRNAVAQTFMLTQATALENVDAFESGVLEIALDETEMLIERHGANVKAGRGHCHGPGPLPLPLPLHCHCRRGCKVGGPGSGGSPSAKIARLAGGQGPSTTTTTDDD